MRLIDADAVIEKYGDWYVEEGPEIGFIGALKSLIDEQQTVSGWISVKDRIPDTYKAVITYDKYSGVKENWLLKSKPCVSCSQGLHVTHWMLLPDPPKDGDGDAR
jgi:hypothetical protein